MLMALRQYQSVAEYIERFELLSATLGTCDEELLIGAFMNGLRLEIKAELRLLRLLSLSDYMDMALRIEERNWALTHLTDSNGVGPTQAGFDENGSGHRVSPTRLHSSLDSIKTIRSTACSSFSTKPAATKGSDEATKVEVPVTYTSKLDSKRYTDAEIDRRRALGLCFKCDEKFKPGHHCKHKQLQVLILSEDSPPEGEGHLDSEEPTMSSTVPAFVVAPPSSS